MTFESHEYDVIVVGAGGAGLRAAIEASRQGAKTAIICKSLLGKAHTVMAEGGAAAALGNADDRDGWKTHFKDTMKGGKYLNNWRMAQIHAQESADRIRELEQWGAVFDRTPKGLINQRNFGGHTYPRLAHVGDSTGLEIIRTLQEKGIHSGVDIFMEYTVSHLLQSDDGTCTGCVAYNRVDGAMHAFSSKSLVLATGGITRCWSVCSGSWEYTGDGHALALNAGAELIDMEFVQFHPTGMVWPPSVRGILVTEGVRGEGGVLKNSEGVRFMFDNVPEMFKGDHAETEKESTEWVRQVVAGEIATVRRPPELLTRDVVAKAINKEVAEGRGSTHGGAYLDIASQRTPEEIIAKLPSMHHQFKELAGVDITKEPMEVGPTAHYVMGGVRVDPESQESTVAGLFAAGEVASGLHGANRLGGNSLSDLIVFGKRAGEYAAKRATEVEQPPLDNTDIEAAIAANLAPLAREGGENPGKVYDELRDMMQDKVGIIRKEAELESALDDLKEFATRVGKTNPGSSMIYNSGWHQVLDLANMVDISTACTLAALTRTESRGGHTREDHPEPDKGMWSHTTNVISKIDGNIVISQEELSQPPAELEKLLDRVKKED
jgi:succinate dehydrogenase / fumarate reductase flavoprotein subunit